MNIKTKIFTLLSVSILLLSTNSIISSGSQTSNMLEERKISISLVKSIFAPQENVSIIITNTGNITLAGFIFIHFYHVTEKYNLIYTTTPSDTPDFYELDINETYIYTWKQNDEQNNTAPIGKYWVKVIFLACCGPLATDDIVFYIQNTSITDINEGVGISVQITNIGKQPVTDIPWYIDISSQNGWLLFGKHAEGTIAILDVGEKTVIKNSLVIGLGTAEIIITIEQAQIRQRCTVFGPLVYIT